MQYEPEAHAAEDACFTSILPYPAPLSNRPIPRNEPGKMGRTRAISPCTMPPFYPCLAHDGSRLPPSVPHDNPREDRFSRSGREIRRKGARRVPPETGEATHPDRDGSPVGIRHQLVHHPTQRASPEPSERMVVPADRGSDAEPCPEHPGSQCYDRQGP